MCTAAKFIKAQQHEARQHHWHSGGFWIFICCFCFDDIMVSIFTEDSDWAKQDFVGRKKSAEQDFHCFYWFWVSLNCFEHFKVSVISLSIFRFFNSPYTLCHVYLLFPTQMHPTFPRWSSCDSKSKGRTWIFKSFKAIQSATNSIKTDRILIRVLFSTYKTLFGLIWIFCNYAIRSREIDNGRMSREENIFS